MKETPESKIIPSDTEYKKDEPKKTIKFKLNLNTMKVSEDKDE